MAKVDKAHVEFRRLYFLESLVTTSHHTLMGMYCGTVQNGSEIHTAQSGSATNLWMKTSHIVGIPCVFVYDLAMSIEFALTGI